MSLLTSRWRSVLETMWDVLYKKTGLLLARYQLFTLKLKPGLAPRVFSMPPYLSFFQPTQIGQRPFLAQPAH